jgi:hypothetical protein
VSSGMADWVAVVMDRDPRTRLEWKGLTGDDAVRNDS